MNRVGDWMQTYSGKRFYARDVRVEDIDIRDIAHSLSLQCRFAGHCKEFYSVAQHSIIVASNLPDELKLWGLLHDASEAYLVDLPRPIKHNTVLGEEYRKIEQIVQEVIKEKFGLVGPEPALIKQIDNRMIPTERRDLMVMTEDVWMGGLEPFPEKITPWNPLTAEHIFMYMFYEITGG